METRAPEVGNDRWDAHHMVFAPILAALERQRGHLFPWSAVFLGSGVSAFFALRFEPNPLDIAIIGLISAVMMAAATWGPRTFSPILWAIALLLFGLCLASWRAHYVESPTLSFRYYGPIEGRVIKIDRSASGKVRLTLDEVRLDRMGPARTPSYVRVSLHGDQPFLTDPQPGMKVALTGHLSGPSGPVEPGGFDFQRRAWFERLGAVGYTRSPALRLAPASRHSFALRLYELRRQLSEAIKTSMPGREGPFAAAIITGERADIDPNALEDLRGANLAHLLAISGLHMGLLTGALLGMTRVVLSFWPTTISRISPKKMAAITALLGASVYLCISGASVATQRAYVMAGVMLIAICLDRRALTLRAVAVAALVVLAVKPESIVGPGFQMSFAATVALVAIFAALREHGVLYKLPAWARGGVMLVLSSGVAGLATAPFGAAHFNQVAHYGLIANLVSVPVMGLVVMPGAIIAGLMAPFGLEVIGLEIMRWGLAWILWVADFVTAQEGALRLIASPPEIVLPMISGAGVILCLWQGRWRFVGVLPLALALIIWVNS
ncbi:MAG: ComEC/Rec2 family competence protein [Litoreibacter sp.]